MNAPPPFQEPPPAGGFGAQPVAQAAFGPMQHTAWNAGAKPVPQSAFVVGILPVLVGWFGPMMLNIIASVTDIYPISLAGSLVQLGCIIWFAANAMRTLGDLRRASNNPGFLRWPTLIPLLGSVYWLTSVPTEVRKAKEMHGLQGKNQGLVLYLAFPLFAIQKDLNEIH